MGEEFITLASDFTTVAFILVLIIMLWNSWQYRRSVNLAKKEGKPEPPFPTKRVAVIVLLFTALYVLRVWLGAKLYDIEVSKILSK